MVGILSWDFSPKSQLITKVFGMEDKKESEWKGLNKRNDINKVLILLVVWH